MEVKRNTSNSSSKITLKYIKHIIEIVVIVIYNRIEIVVIVKMNTIFRENLKIVGLANVIKTAFTKFHVY